MKISKAKRLLILGAEGVQIGTRFALTTESSAHEAFKQLCLNLKEGDTKLLLKKLSPTRLVKGDFMTAVEEAEARGASVEEMKELLGRLAGGNPKGKRDWLFGKYYASVDKLNEFEAMFYGSSYCGMVASLIQEVMTNGASIDGKNRIAVKWD